jgi:AraC family transcriptional regulator of arabinose operon
MSQQLAKISNWPERAHAAKYCVQRLADDCRVSVRTLERHIQLRFGKCPQDWLGDLQMWRAMELLPECSSVKEVALELGYKHAHHFSRDFKKCTRSTPSHFQTATCTRV